MQAAWSNFQPIMLAKCLSPSSADGLSCRCPHPTDESRFGHFALRLVGSDGEERTGVQDYQYGAAKSRIA